jgi:hypothetical protein
MIQRLTGSSAAGAAMLSLAATEYLWWKGAPFHGFVAKLREHGTRCS